MVRLHLFAEGQTEQTFADTVPRICALQRIVDDVPSPELIDDGQQTAPSKRIIAQFPQYGDLKTTVGTQMAERIGLETIRSKCPHFNAWVDRLEKLGEKSAAGQ